MRPCSNELWPSESPSKAAGTLACGDRGPWRAMAEFQHIKNRKKKLYTWEERKRRRPEGPRLLARAISDFRVWWFSGFRGFGVCAHLGNLDSPGYILPVRYNLVFLRPASVPITYFASTLHSTLFLLLAHFCRELRRLLWHQNIPFESTFQTYTLKEHFLLISPKQNCVLYCCLGVQLIYLLSYPNEAVAQTQVGSDMTRAGIEPTRMPCFAIAVGCCLVSARRWQKRLLAFMRELANIPALRIILTWLVLGGDPAARSHRVEQFTAL